MSISNITGLQALTLNSNQLTQIPTSVITHLTAIRHLYARIASINNVLNQGCRSLKYNSITSIASSAFAGLTLLSNMFGCNMSSLRNLPPTE